MLTLDELEERKNKGLFLNKSQTNKVNLHKQFERMLQRGIIPGLEYNINHSEEWLTVYIEISKKGFIFSFDSMGLKTSFDGDVRRINNNHYLLPFDVYFDDLDQYIQTIDQNIIEGFLIPNDIFKFEE